jgi:hypothetical protein
VNVFALLYIGWLATGHAGEACEAYGTPMPFVQYRQPVEPIAFHGTCADEECSVCDVGKGIRFRITPMAPKWEPPTQPLPARPPARVEYHSSGRGVRVPSW